MTRSEAEGVYDQGKEAVVAVLLRMDSALTALNAQVSALTARVKELEDRLSKDSHNSGKPPSSDSPFKTPKSLKEPTNRKSGGQSGHGGNTLRFSETLDRIEEHIPTVCSDCGACLSRVAPVAVECRQVYDLPPLHLEVTEHRAHTVVCPVCQCRNKGEFPQNVAQSVQYGPRFSGLCVYLQHYHLLPFGRLSRLCADLFDAPVSEGTLWNLTTRCQEALVGVETAIRTALVQSLVLHSDETGCRLGKRLGWLHTYCTDRLTYYAFHPKRGKAAMQEIGVLPAYEGCAVHDGFLSYFAFGSCRHALCGVHLLRDLTFVYERFGPPGAWAKEMIDLLLQMKQAAEQAREKGLPAVAETETKAFLQRYDRLLAKGYQNNLDSPVNTEQKQKGKTTPFPLRLLDRLRDWKECVCRFLTDVRVPFDNNQAERDLRMVKVRQKVSGCFRCEEGAQAFCPIRGYLSTLAKQNKPLLQALTCVFQGRQIMPDMA